MAQAKPLIIYDNVLENGGTLTADSTATGYDVLNLKDWRPYLKWAATDTTSPVHVTYDDGASPAADADCLVLYGHNLNTIGATVTLQYSTTGAWGGEEVDAFTAEAPSADTVYLKEFTAPGAKRYWRLRITGSLSAAPEIGMLVFGKKLQMERFILGEFDPTTEGIAGVSERNDDGQILGSAVLHNPIAITASWARLTPSWVDSTFRPVWNSHIKRLKPFFWAWDPGDHSSEVYFVKVPDKYTLSMPYDPVRRSLALRMQGVSEAA